MQLDFSQFGPLLVAALVVFAVYRRLRRSFGRQPLRPTRMSVRIALFTVIACLTLPATLRSTQFTAAALGGAVCGVALAIWGAERTRFLNAENRLYYVPHTYTGIAVSLLFLGRLAYRLVQVYAGSHAAHVANAQTGVGADPTQGFAPAALVRSPLTLGLFFVLVGYYVCYYSLVLWKSKHLKAEDIEVPPAAA